jgi:hypothetical protein
MNYLKVKDENLVRDVASKAILNVDNESLQIYKNKKKKNQIINMLQEENKQLKNELMEIKQLLKEILQKND